MELNFVDILKRERERELGLYFYYDCLRRKKKDH
jgi:hypothetical protein